LKTQKDQIKQ